ncbi:hypothetical protein ABB37_06944 [Leptomonas pyrrhocoris]|uniref:Uncharacterized protein n=1 Tax=Leptomonas pyrrhocoris TaxID=157538 RepID=A0A0M9FWS5_LEPPY|nr:hypothetical protein ABB37_06944 [Leptomonas pyrrhocoris]KPA77573.1 hypothetical protein ABB37_06944 [Leptomonas pyrrhocoris]|eukprot:XP_015656012.1 hypothetical protein ABB37_06944 [Leptomonas pyrrhocoris]
MMSMRVANTPAARNGAANEENLDEIRDSLNRIEDVLNRGQHLLYGDDAEEGGEPATVTVAPAPASANRNGGHAYHSYHSTPQKGTVGNSFSSDFQQSPAAHPPAQLRNGTAQTSAAYPPARQALGGKRDAESPHPVAHEKARRRLSGNAARAKTAPASHTAARGLSKSKKDEEDFSASLRARQIHKITREGGRVPNLEEGVDDSDTAQNTSLEELKARIHRELEEYHRNGPLMYRRASYQRKQRASTVPRSSEPGRTSTVKSASAEKAPKRMVQLTTSALQKQRQRQQTTPARGAPIRDAATLKKSSSLRAASKPRAVSAAAPAATVAAPAARRAASRSSKPFWERLYRDAAVQQERRDARVEQRRIELEAERAKYSSHHRARPSPAKATYNAYYRSLLSPANSLNQSREMMGSHSRIGESSVPPQHTSYVPKRTTATGTSANTSAKAPASRTAAGRYAPSGAVTRAGVRQPSAQPASEKPAGASTPPVPLPLVPGSRVKAENDAKRDGAIAKTPKPEEEKETKKAEEKELPVPEERDRQSDSDLDCDTDEGPQKGSPHPYVAPLDLTALKK